VYLLVFQEFINGMHGSRSKIPSKKSRPYIYDVKFLALLGDPHIYDISSLRVKVATLGIQPFVNLISTEAKEDGTNVYGIRGLAVEYLSLSMKKMNMTVEFLQPSLDLSFEAVMTEGTAQS
jgi:hypothetical protein